MNPFRLLKKLNTTLYRMAKTCQTVYRDGGITVANIGHLERGKTLQGKRILITGGSAGIGFAMAKKFLDEGACVIITGRDKDRLQQAAHTLQHPMLHALVWDVTRVSDMPGKLIEASALAGGMPDTLVNNAGVLDTRGFFEVDEATWDRVYATNSKAVFFLSQVLARDWIHNKVKGKILNISSTSSQYGAVIPYGLTKWDVAGLTEGLGKLLYPHGILVNGIAPGRTATAMLDKDPGGNLHDETTSARRFGLPLEMAELAAFLLSDAANYIVGQTIVCDGGYTLRP